jgi:FkbM family methyltransferase
MVDMTSSAAKRRATPTGAVSWIKLRVIAPMIHWTRFAWYGVRRLIAKSQATVETPAGRVVYFAPNAKCFMRTATVYSKEPETVRWIDSFGEDDTLWDIGANMGIYTIYAAANRRRNVVAFEPSPATFGVLCRSVELNRMDDRVFPYCVALGDKKKLSHFDMRTTVAGFAGSSLDGYRADARAAGEGSFHQAAIGYTIDTFIAEFDPLVPNHIKIDVDGADHLVLLGGQRTLADRRVKSVLVELVGGERYEAGMKVLEAAGFSLDMTSANARGNRVFRRP